MDFKKKLKQNIKDVNIAQKPTEKTFSLNG